MILNFIASIALAAVVSYAITPLVKQYFISRNWTEDPIKKHQKTHNATALTTVPRGGGLPVFIGILTSLLVFIPIDKHLLGIVFAASITLIVGLWDDIVDLSPKFRLYTNLLAALIVVVSGIGIAYISNPFGGIIDLSVFKINFEFFGSHSIWVISDLLAIFWIVWCMNITGWAAGVEGQLPGFVSVAAVFIGILGLRYSQDTTQWPVIILAGALAGAYLGFLPHNFYPQTIMPGYSGKSLAGFFLAVLSLLSGAKLATLILLLGIPMIDASFVLIRRIVTKRSIFRPDGQHLHHLLLKAGWSRSQIAVFYWSITFILGMISLFLNSQQKLYVFIGLLLIFLSFLLKIYQRI